MIALRTEMRDFPESCAECTQAECQLPRKDGEISKRYLNRRHRNCPLRDVTPVPEHREIVDIEWLDQALFQALRIPVSIEYIHVEHAEYTPRVIGISHGDLILIANALFDYANILDDHRAKCLDRETHAVVWARREYIATRFRKIATSITDQIGYDRQLAIEKCNTTSVKDNDVGEEALVLSFKAAERKARAEAQSADDEMGE